MKSVVVALAFLATFSGSTFALPSIKRETQSYPYKRSGANNGYNDGENSANGGAIYINSREENSQSYWRGPSWPGPAGATAQATASASATSGNGGGPVSANANAIAAIGLNGGSNRGGSGGNGGSILIGKRGGLRLWA